MSTQIDPENFRQVLGQYPTGVVVVSARTHDGTAVGMTVGSFTSVSLDPPLVAFLPKRDSSSWKALREAGHNFCVNILGAEQEDICRKIATRKEDKFADTDWWVSGLGNPVIDNAVAYIDCSIETIHEAGDHDIVIGRVQTLNTQTNAYPLLFFRGGYGSFRPKSLAAGDADLLRQLRLVDLARPHMDELAGFFNTEVTAVTLTGDSLVLAAAAGNPSSPAAATRVGHRVPFLPPLGSIYAAWGSAPTRAHWLDSLGPSMPRHYSQVPDIVRERGYSVTFEHAPNIHLESVAARLHRADPAVDDSSLQNAIRAVAEQYNPLTIDSRTKQELHSMAAPVFTAHGEVAFALTLWGPAKPISAALFLKYSHRLVETANAATSVISEHPEIATTSRHTASITNS